MVPGDVGAQQTPSLSCVRPSMWVPTTRAGSSAAAISAMCWSRLDATRKRPRSWPGLRRNAGGFHHRSTPVCSMPSSRGPWPRMATRLAVSKRVSALLLRLARAPFASPTGLLKGTSRRSKPDLRRSPGSCARSTCSRNSASHFEHARTLLALAAFADREGWDAVDADQCRRQGASLLRQIGIGAVSFETSIGEGTISSMKLPTMASANSGSFT